MFHLSSATFQTVKMKPQYPGSWLLHCHVTDHIMAGMETIYTTIEKDLAAPFNTVNYQILSTLRAGCLRLRKLLDCVLPGRPLLTGDVCTTYTHFWCVSITVDNSNIALLECKESWRDPR
ncbi:hephaestin-like protein 1 [Oncorhynchus kisutch]|uniref:hephaestin-like protein 1 n=1 Tax=Oncorhynchus kisutch TaxID=8019 RepID=UPI0012DE1D9F|nr:hephaestin-like protein 1 [Oncorhynchus kisutch]